MRHPFDGINPPAQSSRRSWLGAALAAAASLVALSRVHAVAPPTRRKMDDADPEPKPKPTQALKEQGAGPTTKALREEAAMTRALNENGGNVRPGITTLALGEEGGQN